MKGWRTMAFNAACAVFTALDLARHEVILPDDYQPYFVLFVVIGNAALRSITTTPVGRSE